MDAKDDWLKKELTGAMDETLKRYMVDPDANPKSRYNKLLRVTARTLFDQALRDKMDADDFRDHLVDGLEVLTDIFRALNPEPRNDSPTEVIEKWKVERHHIWFHQDLQDRFAKGYESDYFELPDKQGLGDYVADYLRRPWLANDEVERMVVDAMIFSEAFATGEAAKQHMHQDIKGAGGLFGELAGVRAYTTTRGRLADLKKAERRRDLKRGLWELFWYLAVPALGYSTVHDDLGRPGLANTLGTLYVACVAGGFTLHRVLEWYFKPKGPRGGGKPSIAMVEIWNEMAHTYKVLESATPNPVFLKHRLLASDAKGAVWDPGIFAILEAAIKRDPVTWAAFDRSAP